MVCPFVDICTCIIIYCFSTGNSVLEKTPKDRCYVWIYSAISFGCWNESVSSYCCSTVACFNGSISAVLCWHGSMEQFLQQTS